MRVKTKEIPLLHEIIEIVNVNKKEIKKINMIVNMLLKDKK